MHPTMHAIFSMHKYYLPLVTIIDCFDKNHNGQSNGVG